jgi:hypothetical protein
MRNLAHVFMIAFFSPPSQEREQKQKEYEERMAARDAE